MCSTRGPCESNGEVKAALPKPEMPDVRLDNPNGMLNLDADWALNPDLTRRMGSERFTSAENPLAVRRLQDKALSGRNLSLINTMSKVS